MFIYQGVDGVILGGWDCWGGSQHHSAADDWDSTHRRAAQEKQRYSIRPTEICLDFKYSRDRNIS